MWNAVLKSLCYCVLMPLGLQLLYHATTSYICTSSILKSSYESNQLCLGWRCSELHCVPLYKGVFLSFMLHCGRNYSSQFRVLGVLHKMPHQPLLAVQGFPDDSLCVFADYYRICFKWDHKSCWVCYFGLWLSGFARSTGQVGFVHLLYKKLNIWKSF